MCVPIYVLICPLIVQCVFVGSDNVVILWNVGTGEAVLQVDMPDQIYSGSFNLDGSRFVCTCKDKNLRILDTHTGKVLQVCFLLFLCVFDTKGGGVLFDFVDGFDADECCWIVPVVVE